jgi:hypothetical protein
MLNNKNKELTKKELFSVIKIWQHQLYLEYIDPGKNVKTAFKDIGPFGELLAISYNPGYIGSGSGGMGLDLVNRETKKSIEVKTCCTIQNSKCKSKICGAKFNPFFHDKCPVCGSEGKKINDSRFSINAKEFLEQHNKGFFDSFILFHVHEIDHDGIDKKLSIKLSWYRIDFKNEEIKNIKLSYFKSQEKDGKKPICNLLPLSFDFFKLCPDLIEEIYVEINYDDLSKNPTIKYIENNEKKLRVPIEILKSNEIDVFKGLSSYSLKDNRADMIDFTLKIPYRKKTHGKERGDTRKNAYKSVI